MNCARTCCLYLLKTKQTMSDHNPPAPTQWRAQNSKNKNIQTTNWAGVANLRMHPSDVERRLKLVTGVLFASYSDLPFMCFCCKINCSTGELTSQSIILFTPSISSIFRPLFCSLIQRELPHKPCIMHLCLHRLQLSWESMDVIDTLQQLTFNIPAQPLSPLMGDWLFYCLAGALCGIDIFPLSIKQKRGIQRHLCSYKPDGNQVCESCYCQIPRQVLEMYSSYLVKLRLMLSSKFSWEFSTYNLLGI